MREMKKPILSMILFLVILTAVNAVEYTGGGTVESLQAEVLQNYPFTVIDGLALQNFGTLYAYQTAKNYINAQYKLKIDKDTIKGKHELKVRYRPKDSEWITVTFN